MNLYSYYFTVLILKTIPDATTGMHRDCKAHSEDPVISVSNLLLAVPFAKVQ